MGNDTSLALCGCGRSAQASELGARRGSAGLPIVTSETVINAKLLRGAKDGDAALVRFALDVGANTETRQVCTSVIDTPSDLADVRQAAVGWTPLMFAARGGHLTCVMALLDARASVEAEDEEGCTALHFAAVKGDLDVFKALVLGRGDGLVHDRRGRLPLECLPDAVLLRPDEVRMWDAVMRNELPACAARGDTAEPVAPSRT
eukprot:SRR837773.11668.p1 GENE.SRR837773.11668~~SRR837773.11668.p1  ORF type:complete len:217 (-),score=15.30 SRR837773.11668:60-671(-)